MVRKPLLGVAAFLAVVCAARATTIIVSEPTALVKTDYETVDDADGFVVMRAVGSSEAMVRFKIEEALKGVTAKTLWLTGCIAGGEPDPLGPSCDYTEGARYVIFLAREEDGWTIPDFGFVVEVKPEDEDWLGALRLFAGISALDDDAQEEKALRELREAALAAPERYPAKLVRTIDQHFGLPSTSKPFSDLLDLYDGARNDRERLEVLRALRFGEHVETAGLFRGLLLGGEPLWLMKPVLDWMGDNPGEAPRLADLARVWLAHPGEDRTGLLELMLDLAEPGDAPLLWSLVVSSGASLDEKKELVEWVLDEAGLDGLRLPPDEALKKDLFLLWLDESDSGLEALLRQDEVRDWKSVPRVENLVEAFEASRRPAERRQILLEIARRDRDDLAVVWRLLRGASDEEAEVLLQWASLLDPPRGLLVDYYRGASGEEARNRALWLLFAVAVQEEVEPLLSVAGVLGEGSVRLERVVQAFQSCPNAAVRSVMAVSVGYGLAQAEDLQAVLRMLEGASLAEARTLAHWLEENPAPEALPLLWRLPVPSLYDEPQLANALAAAGDSEVLDLAIELRHRVMTEGDKWLYAVLARSPLPAAMEEAHRIQEEGGTALEILTWERASVQLLQELNREPSGDGEPPEP
ncbi:MAG: hypothetical protein ACJ76J_03385 [Thermoanaerobaculia bacterium]